MSVRIDLFLTTSVCIGAFSNITSAGLLPPLRQTARCTFGIFVCWQTRILILWFDKTTNDIYYFK